MACEDLWAQVDIQSELLDQAIANQQQWTQTVIFRSQQLMQATMEAIACEQGNPIPLHDMSSDLDRLAELKAEFLKIVNRNRERQVFQRLHSGKLTSEKTTEQKQEDQITKAAKVIEEAIRSESPGSGT